ncbi:MAG: hypothetical protein LBN31_06325 [Hungatella sp.]|jgi:hypothetical protein|nr:hypothetical protein [Hungatella sp.]
MFDSKGRFTIEDYNQKPVFSSFLPGISGIYGIPLWCFYTNRGQAVASFGVENKNHSIMEFYPAHQAYQLVRNMGFRTFIKVGSEVYEPFRLDSVKTRMYVGMNELELEEINEERGLKTNVLYYTLPDEAVAGLVRRVTIQNISKQELDLQILDGMPEVIPYGIGLKEMKEIAQTMKAWMQVEDVEKRMPYYRVRYSTGDSAVVSKVKEGNFLLSLSESGQLLPIIADPELVFEYDTAMEHPLGLIRHSLEELLQKRQITQNLVPSGFSCLTRVLSAGESVGWNSVAGQASSKKILSDYGDGQLDRSYFEEKYISAAEKTRELGSFIHTKTSDPVFDAYCEQTYVDNVLRGGFPIKTGKDSVFYVYSRKHGDMERDYNDFSMVPEYYTQGNGNFRDVNQNRRSDVLFAPYVKDHNIKLFYNLLQLDGYNPLVVRQVTYKAVRPDKILEYVKQGGKSLMRGFFQKEFSPGSLFACLEQHSISLECRREEFLSAVVEHSSLKFHADFGEGYWTDHWTYHLDLIETYLSVYPEMEKHLLFSDKSYTYYESRAVVKPRHERYVQTERGIRQYHALCEDRKKEVLKDTVSTDYGKGTVYVTNLMTKLVVLAANKAASLDMSGLGIEMEAGKPGWYDALNGLPGLLGSSMPETFELYRLLKFMESALVRYEEGVTVPAELYDFIKGLDKTFAAYEKKAKSRLWVWNECNGYKERYRAITVKGVRGDEISMSGREFRGILLKWISYVEEGIQSACKKDGRIPTYYIHQLDSYEMAGTHIIPENLQVTALPLFLEGFVRYMKLPVSREEKLSLYHQVKKTGLYDTKLKMYKVNESLDNASFEIGRAKAFSPGWLENESIWLHMEYKYLLELLQSKLYDEFFQDFRNACIPFLDEEVYGRSLLENSSFLVSSANADDKLHGRGFVARLSGSTAEFLQMWQIMMFGEKPFRMEEGQLCCFFEPAIPGYLIPEDKTVEANFLGKTKIVYEFFERQDMIPGSYRIEKMELEYLDGQRAEIKEAGLFGDNAMKLRAGKVKSITIKIGETNDIL